MTSRLPVFVALVVLAAGHAAAQDARAVLQAASTAIRADSVRTIQYSGTGFVAAVGQQFDVLNEDYPRFDVTQYTRTVDFGAMSSVEELTRRQGNNPPRGGGGTPLVGDQQQVNVVRGSAAWNMQGTNVVPMPALADVRQLEIIMTPHGFLRAATAALPNVAVFRRRHLGRPVTIVSFTALGKYRINGTINEQNLVDSIQTWIPNPMLGDMLYEVRMTEYKDFGGVLYPSLLHFHQGNRFIVISDDAMEIRVTGVKANVEATAPAVPDAVRTAAVAPARTEAQKLGEGVWLIAGGSHHSLAVEFADFVTVVEAPLNEERSLAVIAEVGRLLPNKPIRYVVNTHHHADHAGGLRTYVSEGATIVTHLGNREYYEKVIFYPAPRTLQPDRLSAHPIPTVLVTPDVFETLTQKYVISDGKRSLDLYAMNGVNHSANMLLAYLPAEKILVNADLYSPPAQGAQPPAIPTAGMTALRNNLQRLRLEVSQHVPIHGRVGTHEEFLRLMEPAGRTN